MNEYEAIRLAMGDEPEPTCDICGEPEDHEVGWFEYDWNGETGNHLSCEAREKAKAETPS